MDLDSASQSESFETLGLFLGNIATLCFTLQYIPQAYKNWKRKSIKGFSTTGIVIKLVGAAFLMVNAFLLGEPSPVVLYGLFNVIQHSIFIFQFGAYTGNTIFYFWLLFPVIPYTLGVSYPSTMLFTNSVKPLAQVFSHFPQLMLCVKLRSTSGVSMATQHLNVVGGLCGLAMTLMITPKSSATYFIYLNSCFQALSLYAVAVLFSGWKALDLPGQRKVSLPQSI